ncbi:MAG: hypothetical protein CMI27_07055 [Opitutae bacterium]|nr:hypothetical protein [Opitutae bacterium]
MVDRRRGAAVIVTEAKLTEITGYTNGQIRHRRLQAWDKGVHYWADPANTTVYDLEAITAWQTKERPASMSAEASAKSNSWTEKSASRKSSRSITRQLT